MSGGCLFKFGFGSVVSELSLLVQLLLMSFDVHLVLSRSVFQCAGFCSTWLLKYFAMDMEAVGCSKLFVFGG